MGTLQQNCAVQSQKCRKELESGHQAAALSGINLIAELCAKLGRLVRLEGMPFAQPALH